MKIGRVFSMGWWEGGKRASKAFGNKQGRMPALVILKTDGLQQRLKLWLLSAMVCGVLFFSSSDTLESFFRQGKLIFLTKAKKCIIK